MDDRKGVPGISRLTWFWALVFTFFSCGAFALGLGIYLSFWVHAKRKAGVAVYGYLILALSLMLGLLPTSFFPHGVRWENFSTPVSLTVCLLWIANAFVLRRELMLYYASPEGGVLEMSPWLTGLFSVYYLNYCLWVVRDSA
jgi:Mn2+/Fe2+ NRAMP family transporter